MTDKTKTMVEKIRSWSTDSFLVMIIVGGIFGYSELKAYVKIHTFTTPEIKVMSEDFVKKNIGISGRENLEAQRELTRKYQQLTVAIDTLSSIYRKSFESMDVYIKQSEAILEMVNNVDSLSQQRYNLINELERNSKIQSNATQLGLDKQGDILELQQKIWQVVNNPNTNFNGD